jgi:hypothetical protein
MAVHYLNTDLDIESLHDLSKIVGEFGKDVWILHHGEIRGYQHASFEIAGDAIDADEAINYFCSLVEHLSREARLIWDECSSRILDVGYESGTSPSSFRSEIKAATIKRVADIGASILVTIYPLKSSPTNLSLKT